MVKIEILGGQREIGGNCIRITDKDRIILFDKNWKYGVFTVKMYRCPCGNQFREYFKGNKLSFILSAHNGGLGPKMKPKT